MISYVAVKELFGYNTYSFDLSNLIENLTIIHGPNGTGKTTVFKMLEALSKKELNIFFNTPFKEFYVEGNKFSLKIKQISSEEIVLINCLTQEEAEFEYFDIGINWKEDFDEGNRYLHEVGAIRLGPRRYEFEGKRYHYNELCEMLIEDSIDKDSIPDFINDILDNLSVKYIGSERLTEGENRRVVENTNILKNIIKKAETKYAFRSKDLDGVFPQRIIEQSKDKNTHIDPEKILEKLNNLISKRAELTKRGILSEQASTDILLEEKIQSSEFYDNLVLKQILSVHIDHNEKKMEVFDNLILKIKTFEEMVTNFLEHKKIEINRNEGYSIKWENDVRNEDIPLEKLSSGEQHFLVLFFELIFKTEENQIILIDEPEISLHISWQLDLVDNLLKIVEMNKNQFLLATHSPSILRNHKELSIPVGYEGEGDEE
ncbi:AAA family ATPase [Halobacillus rhizosphaerae]|uniref:AAA family ATPase n=1 Tax=Halobacillus rhizosphaerae TaxID=3064889 RepID=UPI00398BA8C6